MGRPAKPEWMSIWAAIVKITVMVGDWKNKCHMGLFFVKPAETALPRRKCLTIGLGAGVFSGLFGVGGGSVIVPGALSIPGVSERQATAASLLSITVMALVGSGFQAAYGNLRPLDALVVGIPACAGVLGGTAIQQRIKPGTVRTLFAALLIIVGVVTIAGLHPGQGHETTVGAVAAGAVGALAGVIAGLLGVGGGALFVPALVFFVGLTQLQAEATSLLASFRSPWSAQRVSTATATSTFASPGPIALGSIPGALIGVAIVNLLPIRIVEILFGLLLLWIARRLLRRRARRSNRRLRRVVTRPHSHSVGRPPRPGPRSQRRTAPRARAAGTAAIAQPDRAQPSLRGNASA